ncbi:MAG: YitT family protein [Clostridiales bacterium]|nr:YitT family protein [Clostridiales bacterium]
MQQKNACFSPQWWREILKLNLGTLLTAVGVYFFKFPNHFTTGGVSGISILLSQWAPGISSATMNLILNGALLIVGLAFLGKKFGLRTAYASLTYSLITLLFEKIVPMETPMTSQPLMELLFAVGLPAVGAAILFDVHASSGGTDIIAMLIKKYTRMNIGMGLAMADLVVVIGACFAFGMETGLFSLFGLFLKSVLVDTVMDNLRTCKVFHIITDSPEPICRYITDKLGHSATITQGEGAFTHEKRQIIMTVVNRSQAIRLQLFVRATDPHSFITITSSSEIIGKGFQGVTE